MKVFTTNAILGERGYQHFGIHPMTASLYGHKAEDIVELTFVIHEDQSLPEEEITESTEADYWAWFDNKKKEFSNNLIYPQRFLLNMCFPYGIEATEKAGQGKAYRIEIKNSP